MRSLTNHTKAFIALSVAVVVTYLSVRFLLPLVTPFVMAVFLAILIDPVVSFAHRKLRMPRGLAVFLALIVVSGLLITALSLSVAEIAHEIDQLSRNVGGLSAAITKAIESLFSRAVLFVEGLPQPIASYISEQQRTIVTFLESAVATVGGWLALFPSFVLMMLISLLATFFISKDFYQFSEGMFESIPLRWRHRLGRVRTELLTGFVRYLVPGSCWWPSRSSPTYWIEPGQDELCVAPGAGVRASRPPAHDRAVCHILALDWLPHYNEELRLRSGPPGDPRDRAGGAPGGGASDHAEEPRPSSTGDAACPVHGIQAVRSRWFGGGPRR